MDPYPGHARIIPAGEKELIVALEKYPGTIGRQRRELNPSVIAIYFSSGKKPSAHFAYGTFHCQCGKRR